MCEDRIDRTPSEKVAMTYEKVKDPDPLCPTTRVLIEAIKAKSCATDAVLLDRLVRAQKAFLSSLRDLPKGASRDQAFRDVEAAFGRALKSLADEVLA